jgi:hypothetical protein
MTDEEKIATEQSLKYRNDLVVAIDQLEEAMYIVPLSVSDWFTIIGRLDCLVGMVRVQIFNKRCLKKEDEK